MASSESSPWNSTDSPAQSRQVVCGDTRSSPSTSISSGDQHVLRNNDRRIAKRPMARTKCRYGIPTCAGCSTSSAKALDEEQISQHRRMFWAYMFSIGLPGDDTIHSPPSYRTQMKVAFLDAQFPPSFINRQKVSQIVDDWLVPRGDAMAAAVDTLLLVQHGLNTKDKMYKIEGRRRHEAALHLLNDGLQSSAATNDDSFLGAIDILGASSMFIDLTNDENRWIVHCRGLCGLLAARGPDSIQSQFVQNLVSNFRHVALLEALQTRRSFVFGQPEWLAKMREIEGDSPTAQFHSLACEAPALLEEVDRICATKGRWVPTVADTYLGLVNLESRLQDWLLQTYKGCTNPAIRLVDISQYPAYFKQYGHLKTPFSRCIEFSSNFDNLRYGFYWTVLITLRDAIYDLAINRPASLCITEENQQILKTRVYECADSLCQSVPFVCSDSVHRIGASSSFPSYIGGALSICLPLKFAMKWYQKQGDDGTAAWCDAIIADVRDHLREQGLSWLDASSVQVKRIR